MVFTLHAYNISQWLIKNWTNIAFYRESTWYAPTKVEIDEMYFPVLKVQNAKHVVKEHLLVPSMSFYPDFIQILSRFYPYFIKIF